MRQIEFIPGNRITLLQSGADFFPALIAAIDAATTEIFLETYIFSLDETGNEVGAALARAAERGVTVSVVTDWLGSGHRTSVRLKHFFAQANINHRVFNSWFRAGIARTHRKMCVVDSEIAFVGGLNINSDMVSDDGMNIPLPYPRWDFAVSIRGPLVDLVRREWQEQWLLLNGLHLRQRLARYLAHPRARVHDASESMLAALVMRDNLRNRFTIQKTYLQALGRARSSALLANPYFAPNRKLRNGLAAAARRGVKVTLLLGVGQFRVQDAVAQSFYPKLLKAGVRVVEYRKTQLHGKVAVIDDEWTTVGSSNWDGLSLFINHEANVVIKDREFARTLRHRIDQAVEEGVVIRLEDYANTPWYRRAWFGVAASLYKTILRIVTLGRYTE